MFSKQSLQQQTVLEQVEHFARNILLGRDVTHGIEHAEIVRKHALKIARSMGMDENSQLYVQIIALLHDVADHKYDSDGAMAVKVLEFLRKVVPNHAELFVRVISYISWSRENKAILAGTPLNYAELLGEYGALLRLIVSDADKIDSINAGRCAEYSAHIYREKNGREIPADVLKFEVLKHADEKLLKIKDEFIHTAMGKELAAEPHRQLVDYLNNM